MIRTVALLLALAVVQPALAQTAPTSAPKPSPIKPSPAKPALKKPAPPKPDAGTTAAAAAQHGPCIGVIPHIGESFVVQRIGVTVFGNESKEVPVPSWGLDDLVVARVRAAAGTRIAVRRIAYPANAFEPYDNPQFSLLPKPGSDLKSIVQTIARGSGCERYIVVLKGVNQFRQTNQAVKGIGIVNRGIFVYLFAITALVVFDGHTFEVLKKGHGFDDEEKAVPDPVGRSFVRTSPIPGPSRELKELRWPTEPDAVYTWPPAPDTVMGLRDATRAMLAESLDNALPNLLRGEDDGL